MKTVSQIEQTGWRAEREELRSQLTAAEERLEEIREAAERVKDADLANHWKELTDLVTLALSSAPSRGRVVCEGKGIIRHVHNKPDQPHTYIEYDHISDYAYRYCIAEGKLLADRLPVITTVRELPDGRPE